MKTPTKTQYTLIFAILALCAIVIFNAIEGSTGLPKISGAMKKDSVQRDTNYQIVGDKDAMYGGGSSIFRIDSLCHEHLIQQTKMFTYKIPSELTCFIFDFNDWDELDSVDYPQMANKADEKIDFGWKYPNDDYISQQSDTSHYSGCSLPKLASIQPVIWLTNHSRILANGD